MTLIESKLIEVTLPELGEGIQDATVACWHKAVGDIVKKDEDIVELVTDKASFQVSALESGRIQDILVLEGESAKIGEILVRIQTGDVSQNG